MSGRITKVFVVRKDMTLDCAFLSQVEADNYCYERNAEQRQAKRAAGEANGPWIYYHWDQVELKRPR